MTQYTFQAHEIKSSVSNIDVTNAYHLVMAAKHGDVEQLEKLIALVASPIDRNVALEGAVENGHIVCVKALLPYITPKLDNNYALMLAASSGNAQCVQLLIPLFEPNNCYESLFEAVKRNQAECVKLLVPVTDLKQNNSRMLQWAAMYQPNMVDLLLDASDIDAAIEAIQDDCDNDWDGRKKALTLLEEKRNQRQNQILRSHIENTGIAPKRHKI